MRPCTVHEIPPLHPNVCMKCRANEQSREYFVDIGLDFPYDGVLYLCNACMEDIANTTKLFYTKEQVSEFLNAQSEVIDALNVKVSIFENLKEDLLKYTDMDLKEIVKAAELVMNRKNKNESSTKFGRSEPILSDIIDGTVEKDSGTNTDSLTVILP